MTYGKKLLHLRKQCFNRRTAHQIIEFEIDKRTNAVAFFRHFQSKMKFLFFHWSQNTAKVKALKFKHPSTGKYVSINTLMEEVKLIRMERSETLNIELCQKYCIFLFVDCLLFSPCVLRRVFAHWLAKIKVQYLQIFQFFGFYEYATLVCEVSFHDRIFPAKVRHPTKYYRLFLCRFCARA